MAFYCIRKLQISSSFPLGVTKSIEKVVGVWIPASLAGFIKTTSKWERRWAPEALDVCPAWQMPKISARPAANQTQPLLLNSSRMLFHTSSRKTDIVRKNMQVECGICSQIMWFKVKLKCVELKLKSSKASPEFVAQGFDLGLAWTPQLHNRSTLTQKR